MGKREIIRAAKKAGLTVTAAHCDWVPEPGEVSRQWSVSFSYDSGEYDDDTEYFDSAADAVAYFKQAAMTAILTAPGADDGKY